MYLKCNDFLIRRAKIDDMFAVAEMVNELAVYHNSDDVRMKLGKDLQRDGFEREPPAFQCIVAEVKREHKYVIVGYALYYPVYSSWRGKSLLLEDLFVKNYQRGHEIGTYLFEAVVKEAYLTRCSRVDFHVAGWNRARSFYERKGAVNLTKGVGICYYRLSGDSLGAAAAAAEEAGETGDIGEDTTRVDQQ